MSEPYYQDDKVTMYHGDCLDVLRTLPDASVDAVVTDPPYGLGFMGKEWDSGKSFVERKAAKRNTFDHVGGNHNPTSSADAARTRRVESKRFGEWCELWAAECLRVLKPGGHLLAFGGSRTWHRLTAGIEDAGFEIRDSIAWLYGSGFPKSLDVSKAIDRARDDRGDILRVTGAIRELRDAANLTNRDLDDLFNFAGMAGHWTSVASQPAVPTVEQWSTLRDVLNPPAWLDAEVWRLNGRKGKPGEAWATATVLRTEDRMNEPSGVVNVGQGERVPVTRQIKAANSEDAARWEGWGTALKPAFEPIVVARKPLAGTVAQNVLQRGTGALNIDGCRIETEPGDDVLRQRAASVVADTSAPFGRGVAMAGRATTSGRWPANVVLDESQAAALDRQSGEVPSGIAVTRNGGGRKIFGAPSDGKAVPDSGYTDSGGASRFFPVFKYEPKAASAERPKANGIAHPTVKPLDLMRWLVRLVTPPGGTVLDPFAGSGTTAEACIIEGFPCIVIEREADYLPLIMQRLSKPIAPVLDLGALA